MKIGIIVKEFPPNIIGGTETQAMRLAEQLSKRYYLYDDVSKWFFGIYPKQNHRDSIHELDPGW
jgi:hypothetical protein